MRSAAPSSARSPASYADASTSSDGYGLGGAAPAAAPSTSGRAFGSIRAFASSEATTRALRCFCLSSRRRCRRSRREYIIDLCGKIARSHRHSCASTSCWLPHSGGPLYASFIRYLQCRPTTAMLARESGTRFGAAEAAPLVACARPRHPSLTTAAPPGGDTPLPTGPPFCAYRQPCCILCEVGSARSSLLG